MKSIQQQRAGDGTQVFKELDSNEPANETFEARMEQLGPFLAANATQSQSATAMTLAGSADQSTVVAGRAGTIVGIVARVNAAITAGSTTFRATLAGTASGDALVLNTTNTPKALVMFTTPVAFNALDLLAITQATDGTYAPATLDAQAWLLIRWNPS